MYVFRPNIRVCRFVNIVAPLFPLYTRFFHRIRDILGVPVAFRDLAYILD